MRELFEIIGFFSCAAAVAFGLSYLLFRLPIRKLPFGLAPGAMVRIKAEGGVYRTRFLRRRQEGLVFAAPLQRDHYVPLHPEEEVKVEAPMRDGVLIFRSKIVERHVDSHEICLAFPQEIHRKERRECARKSLSGKQISVEERPAWLLDISEFGAKFARNGPLQKGERIRVDLADRSLYGWVLECTLNVVEGEGSHVVRARFEEPVRLTPA